MEWFAISWQSTVSFYEMVGWPWWGWILLAVGIWQGWNALWWIIRYLERRLTVGHLVHLRITLPRNDSKLDREKAGSFSQKDFHEQIGKAEQFFRTIYESRDLNLYNVLVNRWLWQEPVFSFEFQFHKQQFVFVIVCDPYYQRILQKQITAMYESAEIEILAPEDRFVLHPKGNYLNGFYLHQKKPFWFPIKTYKKVEEDSLNSVANAFSKLSQEETACIQLILHPNDNKWQKKAKEKGEAKFKNKDKDSGISIPIITPIFKVLFFPIRILFRGYDPNVDGGTSAPGASSGDSYVRMLQTEEEVAKAMGEKANQVGFCGTIRLLASSPQKFRVQEILDGLSVAFNVYQGAGTNSFENRRIVPLNVLNSPWMKHNFKYRMMPWGEKKCLFSAEEAATLYHFPDARFNRIPTIKWLDYKVLPPPINLPEEGIVLGENVYRGINKSIRFQREDRTRHCYVVGKSGSGKSVMLWNMAVQDIVNGEGVGVVDPHGDLIEDCLACVPKERAKEIIVFDPGDNERPLGINLLEAETAEQQDRASLDAMEIFIKLFGNEIFGPRIQHYFRNGCLTLMADKEEGGTLIDIPRLFIDEEFQRYKVSKVQNPVVRAFWEHEMAQTGDREKQEMIPYFTSKFGPFVTNTTMRNIIGQTKSAFDIRQAMDDGKVLLLNLSKGKIGGINAQLLGLIFVAKINQAAMGRVDTPADQRRDFYLYVDEFQNFATDTFASILSEARKYRLNLTMAHQYIAQLSEGAGGISIGQKDSKIRDAVFGNVGTMLSFKVGADDGEYLEKEYAPTLSNQDIIGISNYKAYIKLNINNTTSRPFSLNTLYDPSIKNEKVGTIIKKYSRMKYGRKKEFVDAEIEVRMGIENLDKIATTAQQDPTTQAVVKAAEEKDLVEAQQISAENPNKAEKIKLDPSKVPAAQKPNNKELPSPTNTKNPVTAQAATKISAENPNLPNVSQLSAEKGTIEQNPTAEEHITPPINTQETQISAENPNLPNISQLSAEKEIMEQNPTAEEHITPPINTQETQISAENPLPQAKASLWRGESREGGEMKVLPIGETGISKPSSDVISAEKLSPSVSAVAHALANQLPAEASVENLSKTFPENTTPIPVPNTAQIAAENPLSQAENPIPAAAPLATSEPTQDFSYQPRNADQTVPSHRATTPPNPQNTVNPTPASPPVTNSA